MNEQLGGEYDNPFSCRCCCWLLASGGSFSGGSRGLYVVYCTDTINTFVFFFFIIIIQRPGLLERRPDVRFALKCQAFIELVKKGDLTTAVALAQVLVIPCILICWNVGYLVRTQYTLFVGHGFPNKAFFSTPAPNLIATCNCNRSGWCRPRGDGFGRKTATRNDSDGYIKRFHFQPCVHSPVAVCGCSIFEDVRI